MKDQLKFIFIKVDSSAQPENLDFSQILEYMNYVLEVFQTFPYKLQKEAPISFIIFEFVAAIDCFFPSQPVIFNFLNVVFFIHTTLLIFESHFLVKYYRIKIYADKVGR